jgi:hypothetical protein
VWARRRGLRDGAEHLGARQCIHPRRVARLAEAVTVGACGAGRLGDGHGSEEGEEQERSERVEKLQARQARTPARLDAAGAAGRP